MVAVQGAVHVVPPVLVHTSAECNLFVFACAHRAVEYDLGLVVLDVQHAAAAACGANVDHEDLALGEALYLGLLLATRGFDTQQTAQQVELDLDL